jgi:alanine racemase
MKKNGFTYAQIDLGAIAHNIAEIKKALKKGVKFMAVVKADGYGHGAIEVSKAAVASGVDYLSVASFMEAIQLREAGVSAPILILSESPLEFADDIVANGLTQTVYTMRLAEALSKAANSAGKTAKVHLKVDTGMGRIGAFPHEAEGLLEKIKALPGVVVEGLFTHFAKADDPSDPYTRHQLSLFNDLAGKVEKKQYSIPLKHAANSAASLYYPDSHLDMVRIGLAMYGISPGNVKSGIPLKSALSFKTKIMFSKRVPKGTKLSYGATYETPRETTIVTIPVGYADGFSRALSNKAQVLINGKRFPVAGRVCMDMTLVDVGDENLNIGDEVVLIGSQGDNHISADEIARLSDTISYEVVCGIGKRVPRVYKK